MSIAFRRGEEESSEAGSSSFKITQHVCPPLLPGKFDEGSQVLPQGRKPQTDTADECGQALQRSDRKPPTDGPGESSQTPQSPCRRTQTESTGSQLITATRWLESDTSASDPLCIGLPNYGNSCYQNATLQPLLGLTPFLSDMLSLISDLSPGENSLCRTLHGVAELMVLRQKGLSRSVSSHLNDLRDVFADIDPAFRGIEMQDANEFLLRLLDTMKEEIDARRPTDNLVRDNFQYQTVESYMCTKCHETVLKQQENICWFVSVPHRQGTETPTLQDALRLCMRPDRRELLCQHCRHDECRVTTKISQLPRTLIVQLNRYVFLGEESKKICSNVGIPKLLSLKEHVADDVTRPPEWKCTKPALCILSDFEESEAPSSAQAELVVLDADSKFKPARTCESKDRELQEAIMRSLEGAPADASEQAHLSELCVEDGQSPRSVDLAGDFTYLLVGVVSHYGSATDRWFHYDDRRVSCVDEADVLGEAGHQRNGYIFFYLHKDLCDQVVSVEEAGGAL
ncbi:ubiquitin carboxyl-terminal hydrolase 37-like [Amphibalanus amphitrite]|uniref:ubiquitin carboxyl-terminal hydrolase 37-like n=1 Tax=Amphibalanus amphitrite TaxID=1232801 RepID=UPI001C90E347|nr:ubiquitin carboxyl-terminal hydrolase 37-like [Amphibalanus amphitrite]